MRNWKLLDEGKWELLAEEHLGAQPNKYWFVNIETNERALFKPDAEAKKACLSGEHMKLQDKLV